MITEVYMPKNGMDMTEGTLVRWLKNVGERVEKDEPIMEIETDKVTMESESPASGVLLKKVYEDGAVVPVLTTLGYIGEAGEAIPDGAAAPAEQPAAPERGEVFAAAPEKTACAFAEGGAVAATPYAKTLAQEYGVALEDVTPSGMHGEMLKGALMEIDYYTIALLAGLFVVIGGISEAGIIDLIGNTLAKLSGTGSRMSILLVYSVIVWMSVILSAFIDNIPYTATMLPIVAVITEQLNTVSAVEISPNLLYFGLLVGATLGGNLTPIGASANIAGIGILRKEGCEVSSGTFMKYGVPFTLAAVVTGYVLVWLIWM